MTHHARGHAARTMRLMRATANHGSITAVPIEAFLKMLISLFANVEEFI